MKDVQIPSLGESVVEGVIVRWLKQDGDRVALDEPVLELETDKASVEIPAPAAGTIHVDRAEGDTVQVGDVVARIDPADAGDSADRSSGEADGDESEERPSTSKPAAEPTEEAQSGGTDPGRDDEPSEPNLSDLSPAVRRLVEEHDLDPEAIDGTGKSGRISKADVLRHLADRKDAVSSTDAGADADTEDSRGGKRGDESRDATAKDGGDTEPQGDAAGKSTRGEATESTPRAPTPYPAAAPSAAKPDQEGTRTPITRLRRRIAERLLEAQHSAAILTTFNEVDMSAVLELRSRFKKPFEERHGTRLGFMSFFAKACIAAMSDVPLINARLDGDDILQPASVNLGIAVGTPRGLVVPIVHQANTMTFAGIEAEIARLAAVAQENKLSIDDLSGGTFTISNGGVYGSLLSTPILNPPQSGILGMHKIEKRPVVVDDQIVIRPMMYLALSYDHRLIDGSEAVTFLVGVKQRIEAPERLLFDL